MTGGEVLVGRLIFAPKIDGSARYYEFTGRATLSGLLAGVVTSDMMVTPAGFGPVGVRQVRGIMRVA